MNDYEWTGEEKTAEGEGEGSRSEDRDLALRGGRQPGGRWAACAPISLRSRLG